MRDKIYLKEITLPIVETGENETYSFVQTDADLDTAGDAADAKAVGDEISDLKQDFNQLDETKADKNSDNPNMGAGYASQLVSSLRKSDSVPYNFRKVPYDATLEDGSIVGVSVAWNQLEAELNSSNWEAESGVTVSFDNGVITVSSQTINNGAASKIYADIELHTYFIAFDAKGTSGLRAELTVSGASGLAHDLTMDGNWMHASTIKKCVEGVGKRKTYLLGRNGTYENLQFKNAILIDLTQMLGTTIADYVYSLETATAGSGVAWLKEHFPKQFGGGYQAYNAGEIKSISGLAEHKSVGFNQWDEEWEVGNIDSRDGTIIDGTTRIRCVNFIPVVGGTSYCFHCGAGNKLALYAYDANKAFIGTYTSGSFVVGGSASTDIGDDTVITLPSNCRYIKIKGTAAYGTTYNHDICVNISKPTGTPKNGDYVPYESHTYALDSTKTLRGILKLDSNNKLYADGDVYRSEGKKDERFSEVDLGSLDWESLSSPDSHIFRAPLADAKPSSTTQSAQNNPANAMMSNGYEVKGFTPISASDDKNFAIGFASGLDTMRLVVIDLSQSSTSSFKTAMTGVHLVYEKMTATTESATPYGNPQVINPDGTESYVYTDGAFELPVGHESEYPVNVSGQLDDILDTPTTNGTYTLQATVTDGAVAYEWVSTS